MTFEYELPNPRFTVKPYKEMTPEEARQHFEWFTTIAKRRRELLLSAVYHTGGNAAACDYSPDSLVPLWVWISGHLRRSSDTELTPGTLALILDAGFYFAEVFFRQYPGRLRWMLWTKKAGPHNAPVIEGFKVPLVPTDVVKACAWDVLKTGRKDKLLREKYLLWEKDLPSSQ
jgi:hypothetical protein